MKTKMEQENVTGIEDQKTQEELRTIIEYTDNEINELFIQNIDRYIIGNDFVDASKALSTLFHEWLRIERIDNSVQIQMSYAIQPLQTLLMDLAESQRTACGEVSSTLRRVVEKPY